MFSLPVCTATSAPEAARGPLEMIEQKYGFIPNLAGVFANSPGAMKAFMGLMGAFDSPDLTLTGLERQVVLLTVAAANKCAYCAAAHGMLADRMGLGRADVDNIQQGQPVSDTRLEALRLLTQCIVAKRGHVEQSELDRFVAAGFRSDQVIEIIVGIALKTLTNYVNHVSHPDINEQFAAYSPDWGAVNWIDKSGSVAGAPRVSSTL